MSDQTKAHELLLGNPFADVFPPKPNPDLPSLDGRTVALRVLARYISELTFRLPGNKGSPQTTKYQIPYERIYVEQPDNVVKLVPPCIVFVPGAGTYNPVGLSTFIEEESFGKFGKGTALQVQSEYVETFTIECWADTKPLRRSMVAGLESALVPTETMYGVRFRMPDYFDQPVCFSLDGSMRPDDPDNVRNRRWGHLTVEMRFDMVRLVNVDLLKPEVVSEAYQAIGQMPPNVPLKDGGSPLR